MVLKNPPIMMDGKRPKKMILTENTPKTRILAENPPLPPSVNK